MLWYGILHDTLLVFWAIANFPSKANEDSISLYYKIAMQWYGTYYSMYLCFGMSKINIHNFVFTIFYLYAHIFYYIYWWLHEM